MLAELGIGAALLYAVSGKGSSSTSSAPPPPPPPAPKKGQPSGERDGKAAEDALVKGLAGAGAAGAAALTAALGATPGGVAGGLAYVAQQAALGRAITGDDFGTISGVVFAQPAVGAGTGFIISSGNVANIGRVLARELDKLLGGDPKHWGNQTVQVAGWLGGLLVASWGLTAIPFVGQVFAIFLTVIHFLADGDRLRYGQAGILADTKDAATEFYWRTREAARTAALGYFQAPDLAPADEERLSAITATITQGWIVEEMNQRFNVWKATPAPLGIHETFKNTWGAARGTFLEPGTWPEVLLHCQRLASFNAKHEVPYGVGATVLAPLLAQKGRDRIDLIPVAGELVAGKNGQVYVPGQVDLQARGEFLSNVNHYLLAMKEQWSIATTAPGHAVRMRDVGAAFKGKIDSVGNLVTQGVKVDWVQSVAKDNPVTAPAPNLEVLS